MSLAATTGAISTLGNGTFNNCKLGDPGFGTSYTAFAHSSAFGTGGYALLSDNAGGTYLNSASGQPIYIRNNNEQIMVINTVGTDYVHLKAGSGRNLLIGADGFSGGYIAFYSTYTTINAPSIILTSTNALFPVNIDGLSVGKHLVYTDRKGLRNISIGATTYMISQNTAGNVYLESDQHITQRVGSVDVAQASSTGFSAPNLYSTNPKFGIGNFATTVSPSGGINMRGTD